MSGGISENVTTHRGVMNHFAMRLDILYFLDYDIDEPLPWHSTISRTRQLFPENIFEEVFSKVLKLCFEAGLVISVKSGKARKLNYLCNLVVDTAAHVITDVQAYYADKKNTKTLQDSAARLNKRLRREGLMWENVLADAGYSSGENYVLFEKKGLTIISFENIILETCGP